MARPFFGLTAGGGFFGWKAGTLTRVRGDRLMRHIVRFFDIGALVCFTAMMSFVLLEVFARNVIQFPTTWAEESSRLMLVWTVFLGAASAWYRGKHIVINVLPRRISGRSKHVLQLIIQFLTAIFLLCAWGGNLWIMILNYEATTTALEISIAFFYFGVFLGLTGMIIFLFPQIVETFRNLTSGQDG
jgi:TRAP-type C4-dicarboxylate transport system permease small subunit